MPEPRLDARYKESPEDFEVEEVPSYTPSGAGTHTWLWVEKRGLSTLAAIDALAQHASVNKRGFGYAGMKDAQAVTRQWLSVEHVDGSRFDDLELRVKNAAGLRVLRRTRHENKIKPGHLAGNRFGILLRGVSAEAEASLRKNLTWCAQHGVPNYFGEQRFGKRGANLDQGHRILSSRKPKRKAYSYAPRILKLLLSAVQSEVFNRVLVARMKTYGTILDGDLAWIHASRATFTVHDVDAEQLRCAAFEISPTGPLPGPKMLGARGEVGELEARVLAEMSLDSAAFGAFRSHPGGRRPLRLAIHEPLVERVPDGVRLRFRLESGAYATSVLRQLLASAPWFSGTRSVRTNAPCDPGRSAADD